MGSTIAVGVAIGAAISAATGDFSWLAIGSGLGVMFGIMSARTAALKSTPKPSAAKATPKPNAIKATPKTRPRKKR